MVQRHFDPGRQQPDFYQYLEFFPELKMAQELQNS